RMVLRAPVEIVRHRDFVVFNSATGCFVPNRDYAIEIWEREGFEQQRINRAEDSAVSANTQREGDDGDRRKAGAVYEIAKAITKVTQQRVHDGSFFVQERWTRPSPATGGVLVWGFLCGFRGMDPKGAKQG